MTFRFAPSVALAISLLWVFTAADASAEIFNRKPKSDNPDEHSFPALGSSAERKVNIEWNRFYDHAGLGAILALIHKEFPNEKTASLKLVSAYSQTNPSCAPND